MENAIPVVAPRFRAGIIHGGGIYEPPFTRRLAVIKKE
jgi:hypothetical protein